MRSRLFSTSQMLLTVWFATFVPSLGGCDGASGGAVTAAEVSYSPGATGLLAANLQAAVTELDSRLDGDGADRQALTQRVETLEGAANGQASASAVSALNVRVTDLESAAAPAAADVAVTAVAGLDGETVQAALVSLQAQLTEQGSDLTTLKSTVEAQDLVVTALQGTASAQDLAITALQTTVDAQALAITALEDQLAAPGECPAGMTAVGDACAENTLRLQTNREAASTICDWDGLRLCNYDELKVLCVEHDEFFPQDGSGEWTAHWVDAGVSLMVDFNNEFCTVSSQGTATEGGPVENLKYRCCKSR